MMSLEKQDFWPELLSLKDAESLATLGARFGSTPGEITAAFQRNNITWGPLGQLDDLDDLPPEAGDDLPPEAGEELPSTQPTKRTAPSVKRGASKKSPAREAVVAGEQTASPPAATPAVELAPAFKQPASSATLVHPARGPSGSPVQAWKLTARRDGETFEHIIVAPGVIEAAQHAAKRGYEAGEISLAYEGDLL